MAYRTFVLFISLFFFTFNILNAQELALPLTIDLKNPTYKDGVIFTDQGGVIQGKGFYLQSKNIHYTKKTENGKPVHFVKASTDLMFNNQGQIFIGDYLEYDFVEKKGFILQGKTSFNQWYIHAKKISLNPDKSFDVHEAFITTSDDQDIVWKMEAETIHFSEDSSFYTKNIKFKILNIPIFWIPYFRSDLNYSFESPLKYSLSWDAGQGPKISLRYKVFSWNHFNLYLRGDYRYKRGPGGALEMDYLSDNRLTTFQSKNYLANDTFYNDDDPNKKIKRFRLQGIYKRESEDKKGSVELVFDRISDKNMPSDFKSDDFELNTQKKNRLHARYFHNEYIAALNVEPRVNGFQGFNQELPSLFMNIKPIKLGSTPLVLYNTFNVSYLDYVYSNLLNPPAIFQPVLRDFHSVRAETKQELSLPLHFKYLELNPSIGFIGILYNNNPFDQSVKQAILKYEAQVKTKFSRSFQSYKHTIIPYCDYTGLYRPLKNPNDVYIFNIDDGYHRLDLLRFGVNQLLFNKKTSPFTPLLSFDLYALGFLGDQNYSLFIPKSGFKVTYSISNLKLQGHIRWNFNNHVLDFCNTSLDYTLNANAAFHIEYRHRSSYDWRKGNHNDFILDVTRPIQDLLDSPISDKRNTLISQAELKLAPKWTCQLQMHNGWGRKNEPGYTETKVNLITYLSSAWRLKLSYMYTTRGGSHVGFKLDLVH